QVWKDYLLSLDHLRQGIGLRAYAQRDPLNEYKREAFEMFELMLSGLREQVTLILAHIELQVRPEMEPAIPMPRGPSEDSFQAIHADPETGENAFAGNDPPPPESRVGKRKAAEEINPDDPATWGRVARNAPCPCGSGEKYKRCHGKTS
ncbi:MAG: SEC-C metal-binding domain-containing protein, partial [Proteobacteria bacterium]|nr:SEC-C metal-binding domain-containing protein [Pseudomonadota bacterium]